MPEPTPGDETLAGRVAAIWCAVLALDGLGLDDPLPSLAAQSVKIVEVSLRLYDELGVAVPIETFFQAGTVRQFAGTVARLRQGAVAP